MKKYIVGVALVSIFLIATPAMAAGLTEAQIQAIVSLVSSFGVDSSVVKNVETSLRGQPTTGTTSSDSSAPAQSAPTTACASLNNDMHIGSTDGTANKEVSKLQRFLGGQVSGYFGPKTLKLVQNWQLAHGIVPTTSLDSKTRTAIAQGCRSNSSDQTSTLPLVNPNQPIVTNTPSTQPTQPNTNQSSNTTENTPTPIITVPVDSKPTPTSMRIEFFNRGEDYILGGMCGTGSFIVYVLDQYGNYIVGQPYTFTNPGNGITYTGKSKNTNAYGGDYNFQVPQISGEAIIAVTSGYLSTSTSVKIKPFLEVFGSSNFDKQSDTRWVEQNTGTVVNPKTGMCI